MHLYGIANCTTVKKARTWLEEHGYTYDFHDFKKEGVDPAQLQHWIDAFGWETLVNRQGATWRQLDPATQAGVNTAASALALMLAKPSVIKRPILELEGQAKAVGFKPEVYEDLL